MPIVLVENEVTEGGRYDNWQDVTGERYHFPNQYRKKVTPGREFVYYRGTRRKDAKRGMPEYFGCGVIGEVYPDPDLPHSTRQAGRKWFATIEDFVPFPEPVAAKQGGKYLEVIPQNHWGVGVRWLPAETFRHILRMAQVERLRGLPSGEYIRDAPLLESVKPHLVGAGETLLVASGNASGTAVGGGGQRRSPYAKAIGEWAELVVLEYLRETLSSRERATLDHPARRHEYPGWDIHYSTVGGDLRAIEVKGTKGPKFPSFDLTANEWRAAEEKRGAYSVMLVADCFSNEPGMEDLRDPVGLARDGIVQASPGVWRVSRRG